MMAFRAAARAVPPLCLAMLCLAMFWPLAPALAADTPAAKAAPSAPHSAIPFKQDKEAGDSMAYQSLAALALAGLAAYGIVLGLKHWRGAQGGVLGKNRRVRVTESVRLGRHGMLHVVDFDGEQLLLAEGQQGVQVLSRKPDAGPGTGDA